ncbi:hypothetical protein ACLSU7_06295 [Bdellovibrio sp. HCB185ZH]|uniref:hypothetical protein n=1 Tax=Bdellovibrio sp. HCB185ZH TaxID=3394235 RepID=UPI0039A67E36
MQKCRKVKIVRPNGPSLFVVVGTGAVDSNIITPEALCEALGATVIQHTVSDESEIRMAITSAIQPLRRKKSAIIFELGIHTGNDVQIFHSENLSENIIRPAIHNIEIIGYRTQKVGTENSRIPKIANCRLIGVSVPNRTVETGQWLKIVDETLNLVGGFALIEERQKTWSIFTVVKKCFTEIFELKKLGLFQKAGLFILTGILVWAAVWSWMSLEGVILPALLLAALAFPVSLFVIECFSVMWSEIPYLRDFDSGLFAMLTLFFIAVVQWVFIVPWIAHKVDFLIKKRR